MNWKSYKWAEKSFLAIGDIIAGRTLTLLPFISAIFWQVTDNSMYLPNST